MRSKAITGARRITSQGFKEIGAMDNRKGGRPLRDCCTPAERIAAAAILEIAKIYPAVENITDFQYAMVEKRVAKVVTREIAK